jgi:hypothetical protein
MPTNSNDNWKVYKIANGTNITIPKNNFGLEAYQIRGFLPIPFLHSNIKYANAPSTIIYNITGKMPDYYKDEL